MKVLLSTGLDGMLCGMLDIAHADLIERMSDGGSDDEILEWCHGRGTRLNRAQIHIWNEFARNSAGTIASQNSSRR